MSARLIKLSAAAATLGLSPIGAAHATAVLVNGNFENGLSGWTSFTTSANGTITEIPSAFGAPQPQVATTVSFDVKGNGASSALFLNAGKVSSGFGQQPGEGGGVFQSFNTTGGVATFSADVAALFTRSGGLGIGLVSVLLDGVTMASYDFGDAATAMTKRSTLAFTTNLSSGSHTISLQATRLFAPARGVASQYFDNVSLDVAAVPEPATWAILTLGFGMIGASLRHRRRTAKVAFA